MNRRGLMVTLAAAAAGQAVVGLVGCSGNPNEKGFETQGHADPNIPTSAEEYEKVNTPKAPKKGSTPAL